MWLLGGWREGDTEKSLRRCFDAENCATTGNKIGYTLDQNVVRFAPKADIGSDITHSGFVP
jgi:hypothetical protein